MGGLTLDVVEDDEGFDALREPWQRLERDDPDVNVFLSWPWVSTWWRHFGSGRDDRWLHVVVVRDDDDVVALAPLFRSPT
jgi:hypothetical protein